MWTWPTRPCASDRPPRKNPTWSMDKIIAACKQTGAQAVHPGYGFLSENAEFSRRLEEEGIKFIGPKHYSVAKMGDKIESKKLAIAAKVNTIPGLQRCHRRSGRSRQDRPGHRLSGDDQGLGRRRRQGPARGLQRRRSARISPPASTKPSNSFGDDRVFIEKYVLEPRHIEIRCSAIPTATMCT
jgi:propionyl-CoA carboxylase alpha chain